jgi:hypothetical protein
LQTRTKFFQFILFFFFDILEQIGNIKMYKA